MCDGLSFNLECAAGSVVYLLSVNPSSFLPKLGFFGRYSHLPQIAQMIYRTQYFYLPVFVSEMFTQPLRHPVREIAKAERRIFVHTNSLLFIWIMSKLKQQMRLFFSNPNSAVCSDIHPDIPRESRQGPMISLIIKEIFS